MNPIPKICLSVLFPLVLAGCQTTSGPDRGFDREEIQQLAVELDRFNVGIGAPAQNIPLFPLETWYHVDNYYLFISDGRQSHYLVTFAEPCPDTQAAVNLGVETRGDFMNPGDRIITVSAMGNLTACRIEEINTLVPRE